MAVFSTKTCFASLSSPSWMRGTLMCVQPRSAAFTIFCPMAISYSFVHTTPCTDQSICIERALRRCWRTGTEKYEPVTLSVALARSAGLSNASRIHWCAPVQHGDPCLLCEADTLVFAPAEGF